MLCLTGSAAPQGGALALTAIGGAEQNSRVKSGVKFESWPEFCPGGLTVQARIDTEPRVFEWGEGMLALN